MQEIPTSEKELKDRGIKPEEMLTPEQKIKQEQEKEILLPFTEGHIVNVKRTSGQIESDWVVSHTNKETSDIVILKKDEKTGETLKKEVPLEGLKILNPKDKPPVFSEKFLEKHLKDEQDVLKILQDNFKNVQERHTSLVKSYGEAIKTGAPGKKKDDIEIAMHSVDGEAKDTRFDMMESKKHISEIEEKLAEIKKENQHQKLNH